MLFCGCSAALAEPQSFGSRLGASAWALVAEGTLAHVMATAARCGDDNFLY